MARTGQQMRQRTANAMSQSKGASGSTRTTKAPKSSLGQRMRYKFDNSMSRGTPALIAWLSVVTLLLILLFTVVVTIFNLRNGSDERVLPGDGAEPLPRPRPGHHRRGRGQSVAVPDHDARCSPSPGCSSSAR